MIGRMGTAAAALAQSPLLLTLALAAVLISAGAAVQWITQRRG